FICQELLTAGTTAAFITLPPNALRCDRICDRCMILGARIANRTPGAEIVGELSATLTLGLRQVCPSAIGCKLQAELPTSRKRAAETQGEYPISAIRHWLHEPAGKPCRQLRFNSTGFPAK